MPQVIPRLAGGFYSGSPSKRHLWMPVPVPSTLKPLYDPIRIQGATLLWNLQTNPSVVSFGSCFKKSRRSCGLWT